MHSDYEPYFHFASKTRLKKSLQTIAGVIEGIAIDQRINPQEMMFLQNWVSEHDNFKHRHPLNELLPVIENAISDGLLTDEEREDILWLCDKLSSIRDDRDYVTQGLQRLHGVLAGVIADGVVREQEVIGIGAWVEEFDHLKTCWPFDEVEAVITSVLADGMIDQQEQQKLLSFFSEFVVLEDDRTITSPVVKEGQTLQGVCAVCPEISFEGAVFCITGAFSRMKRREAEEIIRNLGGRASGNVSKRTNYLVIGAEGNPCWMYACYGRKVEGAMNLRKEGHNIVLVHENDFHDAVQEYSG